jgi:hypothetical protein
MLVRCMRSRSARSSVAIGDSSMMPVPIAYVLDSTPSAQPLHLAGVVHQRAGGRRAGPAPGGLGQEGVRDCSGLRRRRDSHRRWETAYWMPARSPTTDRSSAGPTSGAIHGSMPSLSPTVHGTICSGVCLRRAIGRIPLRPASWATGSHHGWINLTGSGHECAFADQCRCVRVRRDEVHERQSSWSETSDWRLSLCRSRFSPDL